MTATSTLLVPKQKETMNLSVVGKSHLRIEGISKVTGTAEYYDDIDLPGLLYAKILRSPYAHAKVIRVDPSAALRLNGVKAVLTPENTPRTPYNSSWRGVFHFGVLPGDEYILENEVRYIGDRIAAVAAEDPETAQEALELIDVEYEKLPAVFDPEEAMQEHAPKVHEKGNIVRHAVVNIGDVEKGFSQADYVFEGKYTTQRQHHCCLETHGSIASYDKATGKLTIRTPNQVPFSLRFALSNLLKMPMNKIRILRTNLGGGFGGKDEMFDEPILSLFSMATGRPVKITYSRPEEFAATRMRHPSRVYVKTGISKEGILTARVMRAVFDTGAYSAAGPVVIYLAGTRWTGLYRAPNIRYDGFCVYTNNPVAGAFRGYGNPQVNFATESQMDEIAEKLGFDAVQLRLKNIIREGDINPAYDMVIQSCGLDECIRRGAERIGWSKKRGRRNGVGVGMGVNCHNSSAAPFVPDKSTAIVRINEDGTATLFTGTSDLGTGSNTIMAQIAAEELGVRFKDVEVVSGDTDVTPYDMGAFASRTTYMGGNATREAAKQAKTKLLNQASAMLKTPAEELRARDGFISVIDKPEQKLAIAEVATAAHWSKDTKPIIGVATVHGYNNPFSYVAQFAEVEVDKETGKVNVLRIVTAHDVGRVVNPKAAESQVEGAVAQGLGLALMEDLIVEGGKVLTTDLIHYKIPTCFDMPKIEVLFVETDEPTGPFGAKGLSESAIVSIAPAISNAIYDAVGVRITDLPILPERLLKVMEQAPRETVRVS